MCYEAEPLSSHNCVRQKKPTRIIPKLNPSLRDKKPVGSQYHGHVYR